MPSRYDSPAAELMADAETCAIEMLAAASDRCEGIHGDVVANIQALPEGLDCLPPPVAAMLTELKIRREWSALEMAPIIIDHVPAVEHSRPTYNALRCVQVIRRAQTQRRAINAAHDLVDAVYAMDRLEVEKRLHDLVGVLNITVEKKNAPGAVRGDNRAQKETLQCKV